MMFPPSIKAFGSLEAWMNDKQNVIRFLLVRILLMTGMVVAFSFLYLSQS
jgi:hypothetical protein